MNEERREAEAQIEFIGVDRAGEPIALPVPEGEDPTALEARIRREGGRVRRARMRSAAGTRPAGVSAEDFARFNEMLASALKRRVPMLEGLRELACDLRRRRFRGSLDNIGRALESGAPLEDAFAPERSGFPEFYGRMMSAGSAAGNLSDLLLGFSRSLRTGAAFRRCVTEAAVYPMLLFAVCCLFLAGFGAVTMPIYRDFGRAFGASVPFLSRMLTAHVTGQRWPALLALGAAALILLIWLTWLRRTAVGRSIRDFVAWRLPFYRRLHEAGVWSHTADMLALLVRARVPLPAALRLVGPATASPRVRRAFDAMAASVELGGAASEATSADGAPERFTHALDAGAARGDLEGALKQLAATYRHEGEGRAETLMCALPVVLTLAVGVLVFLIGLSVFGPIIRFWGAVR